MKLRITSLILTMLVCFSFISCSEKETPDNTKNNSETQTSVTDESLIGAPDYGETIDIDELMTKITVDGVPISLPFTIEDLGKGWHVEKTDYPNNTLFSLYKSNKDVANIHTSTEYDWSKKNTILFDHISSSFGAKTLLAIDGFTFGSNAEKLLEKLGNPTKYQGKYNWDGMVIEYNNAKNNVMFSINSGVINNIYITVNGGNTNGK